MTQLSLDDRGIPLFDATFVVVDLETSGLDPQASSITEIGAVKICGGEVVGEFASFIRIETPLPARITAITGITDAMLASAPPLESVLPQFLSFASTHPLIAHNVPFDVGFLRAAVSRVYGETFAPQTLDTLRLARRLLGDEVRNFRLSTLAQRFQSPIAPDHRALTDARATVHVFHALVERAAGFGATTVDDLHALTRSSSTPQARRKSLIADAPNTAGVYRFIGPNDETLYVGKATDLRQRLSSYFGADNRRRVAALVRDTKTIRWDITDTVLEAEVCELRAIAVEQPRYNVRHRRPERHVDVVLTTEAFPRLKIVTHDPHANTTDRLGPFASHRQATRFVETVADVTGLRDCTMPIRRAQNHPACIRKDVNKCPAPCDGTVDIAGYLPSVLAASTSLADPTGLLASLRDSMTVRANTHRFEEATTVRDTLHQLAFALHRARQLSALRVAGTLVALRHTTQGCDTLSCRNGAFVAAKTHRHRLSDTEALTWAWAAEVTDQATVVPTAEETMLLAAWLNDTTTRIVSSSNGFAVACRGGQALHATLIEGRQLRRQQQQALRQADFSAATNR
ncbi:MAG: DEDD exonuclease domain-containing protein [Nitriliruptoraceae bacterium]